MKIGLGILCLCCAASLEAQQIAGKVTDHRQQPVDGATIVLQTLDSTYITASVSNPDGTFMLDNQPEAYRLIVQHLLYRTRQIAGRGKEAGVIQLEPKEYALEEVVVKAERPFAKVENGRLGYNLSVLAAGGVVNNAYEALAKLPGVQAKEGALTLAGASGLTIILNGKPTTMDAGQLETLLRNTPLDRVEKAEVLYSAPPEYHVRGAVINVVLKRADAYGFQGEVSADYANQYFNRGGMDVNFRFSTPKMAFDILYGAHDRKQMEYIDLYSRHTLKGKVHDIRENQQIRSTCWNHQLTGAFEYNFSDRHTLQLAYTGSYTPDQYNNSHATGNFQTSHTDKYIDTRMHNVSVQYHTGFGLKIGGDYTRYTADNTQTLQADYQDGAESSFAMTGGQQIDRYAVYADQGHALANGWNVGYGASYRLAKDHDFQIYKEVAGSMPIVDTNSDLDEHTANVYVSLGKNYASGTSLSVSATGEYYTIGKYRKWSVYPGASLTYPINSRHMLQLSLATDKTYPGYWDMQSSVSYLSGYSELWGTPGLKPAATYALNGSYLLRQKYIFSLFFMHAPDYFVQAPYQSTDRLALIYKNTNWNYMQYWGANVILPFKAAGWLDSRLTLTGMQMHQRCDDFFDIPFNRKKWVFSGSLDNTFKVGKRLAFELAGNVQTPMIQGAFDIGTVFDLTAGVKWRFAGDKMSLSARCQDIFDTGMPDMKVRFKGQYLDMNTAFYSRRFSLHFTYRFGGYKKKEMKQVDTSRFRR